MISDELERAEDIVDESAGLFKGEDRMEIYLGKEVSVDVIDLLIMEFNDEYKNHRIACDCREKITLKMDRR